MSGPGKIERVGLGGTYEPNGSCVLFRVDYIHLRSDDCKAELEVESPVGSLRHGETINFQAGRSLDSLAKVLAEKIGGEVRWRDQLEQLRVIVLDWARRKPVAEPVAESAPTKLRPDFLVEGLILQGKANTIYGPEGSSKSTIAVQCCVSIAARQGFGGLSVMAGKALYLDWEDDKGTFDRRAWALSRGMGLDHPPDGLLYVRMHGGLGRSLNTVAEIADRQDSTLIVVDSVALASGSAGENRSYEDKALELMEGVEFLIGDGRRTVLLIDQVSAEGRTGKLAGKGYGSIMKQYLVRFAWEIRAEAATNGVLYVDLHHEKFSEGRKRATPLMLDVDMTKEGVTVINVAEKRAPIERVVDRDHKLTHPEMILKALREAPTALTMDDLVRETGVSKESLRVALKRLGAQVFNSGSGYELIFRGLTEQ